jgi:hypothetical protein
LNEFEVRELKSRKFKAVTPILWVGAVALTAQGFPGWQEPTQFKQSQDRALQTVAELNTHPETPQGYYSGHYPGSKLAESSYKRSDYSLLQTPELNSYPPTPALVTYAAIVESGYNFNNGLSRTLQDVELNTYPATPVGYYSGYYPGSTIAKGFKASFDRKLQTVTLDEYPATPTSPALLPAFYSVDVHYRQGKRSLLYVPEQNSYPATPTTPAAPDLWTVQTNDSTTWTVQTNDSSTWTEQT